ncbi:3-hydroxy-3-methylglutaryl-coenzyme A reductase [Winogradskyella wandonensis]|uniref:3-hydroxy-3-methylglutaryl coenzyme A reductase n=1 Tax=Winogradskyella wandonensis TaxID=1442586 RepID=A0A4R1KQV2_9FLAO|nr:hydroxymethylglutaryl-CoA reductase, degradative [Winogradskyella wandonensis]TCK67414.1 3-hydroxy-3-methylglutaryl-coenzyme A reductase [Winogradskyella wandonensis]
MAKPITGFSKLTKAQKIDWLLENYFSDSESARKTVTQYFNSDEKLQKLHDEFIENSISNFYLPLGVAPNFIINNAFYTIPMAIEESSVVAAASKAAKFWMDRGGFKANVISSVKIGQVHFTFSGNKDDLIRYFEAIKPALISETAPITKNMERRGGGILDIELRDKTAVLENYYQLHATFETLDAMGANFINSCLEQFAETFKSHAEANHIRGLNVVMSILSNYVPNCLVRAEVRCKISELKDKDIPNPEAFAEKFKQAVAIAEVEPHRAVTHNKGIMNGIDAVVLATGNDFRAVEAGVHAYASKDGTYTSLTHCSIDNDEFCFWLEIPLALGTIGGLTSLHPLVKFNLELLGKPSAKKLMEIVAVAGLAQNFAALKSLTTTGIQKGHMKMHLMNILNQFEASENERIQLVEYFKNNTVTHSAVVEAIEKLRN